jgi:hypothetical protein
MCGRYTNLLTWMEPVELYGILDNIFIERLWRSMKYECIYLHAFSGARARKAGQSRLGGTPRQWGAEEPSAEGDAEDGDDADDPLEGS